MGSAGLMVRRSLAQAGLLLAVLGSVAVISGVAIGSVSAVNLSEAAGVQATLNASTPTDRAYRFSFSASHDVAAQSAEVATRFSRALSDIPADGYHEVVSPELVVSRVGASLPPGVTVTAFASAQLPALTRLSAGVWPDEAGGDDGLTPAAVDEATAERLGIAVGDILHVADGASGMRIVGIWTVVPSPAWVGPTSVFGAPAAPERTLSALVPESGIVSITDQATARWTMVADPAGIDAGGLDRLITAAGEVQLELAEAGVVDGFVRVDGGLAQAAERFRAARDAARAVAPVGTAVVLLAGAITVAQLARLLSGTRMQETVLLRSRGASWWVHLANSAEAVVVAVIGSALGLAAAQAVASAAAGAAAVVLAVAIGAGGAVIMVVAGTRGQATDARDFELHRSGGTGARALVGLAAILTPIALLAVGQFLVYGSPRVQDAAGRLSVDPFLASAPALGIVAGVIVVLALAGLASRGLAVVAARHPGLQPALSARVLSRRFPQYAGAILVIALAVSGLTVASAYSATETGLSRTSADLRNGAAVRVLQPDLPAPSGETVVASPVLSAEVAGGSGAEKARLIALPGVGIRSVMDHGNGAIDGDALSRLLRVDQPPAPALPTEASALSYRMTVTARAPRTEQAATGAGSVSATVWLEDAAGTLRSYRTAGVAAASGSPAEATADIRLPDGSAPWSIVALDVSAEAELNWTFDIDLTGFEALTAPGQRLPVSVRPASWAPQLLLGSFGAAEFRPTADGVAFALGLHDSPAATARIMPTARAGVPGTFFPGTAEPVPVAVSTSAGEAFGTRLSDLLPLVGDGLQAETRVVSSVATVPGASAHPAVLVDLSALNHYLLRTSERPLPSNETWVETTTPEATAQQLRASGVNVIVAAESARSPMAAAAGTALWMAALGCLLLAVVSLAATAAAAARSRRTDVLVLTAVGVAARVQGAQRMLELTALLGTGLLIGLGTGMALSALVAPRLARSVVLDVPLGLWPRLELAVLPAAVALAAAVLALLIVASAHAMAVVRQARRVGSGTTEAD